ncbi:uncharacterized protein F4822DRAFT_335682 [Hypoxylon trugodes]|uniref:uncharacterized protein n=1 Tax=Hypoxylon trugodes TaxID=326681 RepID=UPI0021A22249|nr:uncharacterized protein F4822DRAFT_335682 [Hypoxylon trugodes]KAI1385166.1 hypothetical protein F4822DRAFT_335682 [Hypoxylon trugodes]
MAPITTFILTTVKAGAKVEESFGAIEAIQDTIKSAPGSGALRVATLHEDANQYRLFIDWESIEAHKAFRQTEAFQKFANEISPFAANPSTVFHAELSPFPPSVLDNAEGKGKTAVAEILFTYYAPTADADKNLALAQKLASQLAGAGFAGATGETAVGWSVEKDIDYKGTPSRALVVILGWETVAAHEAARNSDKYKSIIAEFQGSTDATGFEVSHVTTKTL